MRESAVWNILDRAGKDWGVVNKLISKQKIVETDYNGRKFYLRNFNSETIA
jgi:hypothetical protein